MTTASIPRLIMRRLGLDGAEVTSIRDTLRFLGRHVFTHPRIVARAVVTELLDPSKIPACLHPIEDWARDEATGEVRCPACGPMPPSGDPAGEKR